MFYEPKSYEKAEKYATEILSFNKGESYYHVALGDVYRGQNKLEKAATFVPREVIDRISSSSGGS